MRILVVHPGPSFSVQDVHTGWVEALKELGQKVIEFNLGDRLTFYDSVLMPADGTDPLYYDENTQIQIKKALSVEQAHDLAVNGLYALLYKSRPDVMLVISAFFVPTKLIDLARMYGTKVVVLFTESPYEDPNQLKTAEHVDLALLNDPINIEKYNEIVMTRYVPHAYRPAIHHPGPPTRPMVDFSFIGTAYKSRIDFMEKMNFEGLDVLLGGNWQLLTNDSPLRQYVGHNLEECVDNTETAEIYRSTRVGMNLYRREAERPDLSQGIAMGPREVEMAACGLFFLRDPRPEGDHVLSMMPTFTSPEEASEQLHWWLKRPDECEDLARAAWRAVEGRTFTRYAQDLMRILEG
jgi:hypothetical protein